jgi:hypothetical protein
MSRLRRKKMDGKIHIPDPHYPTLVLCARRREFVRFANDPAAFEVCGLCAMRQASRAKRSGK